MEYYRLLQYLSRGQNIKHLNKHLEKLPDNQRFDKGLFDILAANIQDQPILTGIHLDDEPHDTTQKLSESLPWMNQHKGEILLVTEHPKLYQGLPVQLMHYQIRNNRHEFNKIGAKQPLSFNHVQAADYFLEKLEGQSSAASFVRKVLHAYTKE